MAVHKPSIQFIGLQKVVQVYYSLLMRLIDRISRSEWARPTVVGSCKPRFLLTNRIGMLPNRGSASQRLALSNHATFGTDPLGSAEGDL